MNDSETIPGSEPPLTGEMIEHLRATASWDVVLRPVGASAFPARILTAQRDLKQLEQDLSLLPPASAAPPGNTAALLELRANMRLLRSAAKPLSDQIRELAQLPRVVLPAQRDEPRALAVAALYLRAVNGDFSAPGLSAFVSALQATSPWASSNCGTYPHFSNLSCLNHCLTKLEVCCAPPILFRFLRSPFGSRACAAIATPTGRRSSSRSSSSMPRFAAIPIRPMHKWTSKAATSIAGASPTSPVTPIALNCR
jgi:hypothetical protein